MTEIWSLTHSFLVFVLSAEPILATALTLVGICKGCRKMKLKRQEAHPLVLPTEEFNRIVAALCDNSRTLHRIELNAHNYTGDARRPEAVDDALEEMGIAWDDESLIGVFREHEYCEDISNIVQMLVDKHTDDVAWHGTGRVNLAYQPDKRRRALPGYEALKELGDNSSLFRAVCTDPDEKEVTKRFVAVTKVDNVTAVQAEHLAKYEFLLEYALISILFTGRGDVALLRQEELHQKLRSLPELVCNSGSASVDTKYRQDKDRTPMVTSDPSAFLAHSQDGVDRWNAMRQALFDQPEWQIHDLLADVCELLHRGHWVQKWQHRSLPQGPNEPVIIDDSFMGELEIRLGRENVDYVVKYFQYKLKQAGAFLAQRNSYGHAGILLEENAVGVELQDVEQAVSYGPHQKTLSAGTDRLCPEKFGRDNICDEFATHRRVAARVLWEYRDFRSNTTITTIEMQAPRRFENCRSWENYLNVSPHRQAIDRTANS